MHKLSLFAVVVILGILITPVNAGKIFVHGNYSMQGYSQTASNLTASTPFNNRLGYGLGYMFGENDGPRIEATFFTSGTYDAVSGKVNIDVTAYDFSWVFAINSNLFWSIGAGLNNMKFSTGTSNMGGSGFLSLGYRISDRFYLEAQSRTDYSVNTVGLASVLAHSISGFNLKAGYMF